MNRIGRHYFNHYLFSCCGNSQIKIEFYCCGTGKNGSHKTSNNNSQVIVSTRCEWIELDWTTQSQVYNQLVQRYCCENQCVMSVCIHISVRWFEWNRSQEIFVNNNQAMGYFHRTTTTSTTIINHRNILVRLTRRLRGFSDSLNSFSFPIPISMDCNRTHS